MLSHIFMFLLTCICIFLLYKLKQINKSSLLDKLEFEKTIICLNKQIVSLNKELKNISVYSTKYQVKRNKQTIRKSTPRSYALWSKNEETMLMYRYRSLNLTVKQLAVIHKRSERAIDTKLTQLINNKSKQSYIT